MSTLSTLFLHNNQISTLPTEIFNLTNLKNLGLNDNQIKTIPVEIANLTNELLKKYINILLENSYKITNNDIENAFMQQSSLLKIHIFTMQSKINQEQLKTLCQASLQDCNDFNDLLEYINGIYFNNISVKGIPNINEIKNNTEIITKILQIFDDRKKISNV